MPSISTKRLNVSTSFVSRFNWTIRRPVSTMLLFFTARRECTLNREENRDFLDLTTNRINISCQCQARGYEWSSRFGICVDTNECTSGKHHCAWKDGQVCINLPGSYDCACRFGYVYDSKEKSCVVDSVTEEVLASSKPRTKLAKTKSVIETIVQTVTRSTGNPLASDSANLIVAIFLYFFTFVEIR